MKKDETKFKERVIKDLKALPNCHHFKISDRVTRGIPDFLVCLNGRFVALELKTGKGKLDALQELTIQKIVGSKGFALAVTPESWPEVYKHLKGFVGL